jgi:hypothetical protein
MSSRQEAKNKVVTIRRDSSVSRQSVNKQEFQMVAENREKIQDLKKRLKILGDFL